MTQDLTRSRTCDSLELHLTTLTSWVAGAVYIKIIQLRIIEWKAPECIIITLINTLYRIACIAEKNAFCQKYQILFLTTNAQTTATILSNLIKLNKLNWIKYSSNGYERKNLSDQCSSLTTIYKHFGNHKQRNQPQEWNRLKNYYVLSRDFI